MRKYVDTIVMTIVPATMAVLAAKFTPFPRLRWFSKHGNSVK